MAEVPIRRTVLSPAAAEQHLRDAWRARFGQTIHPLVLRLLLALWDLETAAGQKMWNNNWGNIVSLTDSEPFYRADDSGNARKFTDWPTAAAGAAGFVRQMTSPTRPHWIEGLLSGDPWTYAERLREHPAYYEASVAHYAPVLRQRWLKYPHLVAAPRPPATPATPERAPEGVPARPKVQERRGPGIGFVVALAVIGAGVLYATRPKRGSPAFA